MASQGSVTKGGFTSGWNGGGVNDPGQFAYYGQASYDPNQTGTQTSTMAAGMESKVPDYLNIKQAGEEMKLSKGPVNVMNVNQLLPVGGTGVYGSNRTNIMQFAFPIQATASKFTLSFGVKLTSDGTTSLPVYTGRRTTNGGSYSFTEKADDNAIEKRWVCFRRGGAWRLFKRMWITVGGAPTQTHNLVDIGQYIAMNLTENVPEEAIKEEMLVKCGYYDVNERKQKFAVCNMLAQGQTNSAGYYMWTLDLDFSIFAQSLPLFGLPQIAVFFELASVDEAFETSCLLGTYNATGTTADPASDFPNMTYELVDPMLHYFYEHLDESFGKEIKGMLEKGIQIWGTSYQTYENQISSAVNENLLKFDFRRQNVTGAKILFYSAKSKMRQYPEVWMQPYSNWRYQMGTFLFPQQPSTGFNVLNPSQAVHFARRQRGIDGTYKNAGVVDPWNSVVRPQARINGAIGSRVLFDKSVHDTANMRNPQNSTYGQYSSNMATGFVPAYHQANTKSFLTAGKFDLGNALQTADYPFDYWGDFQRDNLHSCFCQSPHTAITNISFNQSAELGGSMSWCGLWTAFYQVPLEIFLTTSGSFPPIMPNYRRQSARTLTSMISFPKNPATYADGTKATYTAVQAVTGVTPSTTEDPTLNGCNTDAGAGTTNHVMDIHPANLLVSDYIHRFADGTVYYPATANTTLLAKVFLEFTTLTTLSSTGITEMF